MSISNGMSFSLLVSGFLKFSSEAAVTVFLLCVARSEWGPVCWGTGSPGRGMGSRVSPVLFPVTIPGPRWHFYPAVTHSREETSGRPRVLDGGHGAVALVAPRLPHRPFSPSQLFSPASYPQPVELLCAALLFLDTG